MYSATCITDFGDTWLAKNDSQYISANMNSSTDLLINPMTIKETELIKQHLEKIFLDMMHLN